MLWATIVIVIVIAGLLSGALFLYANRKSIFKKKPKQKKTREKIKNKAAIEPQQPKNEVIFNEKNLQKTPELEIVNEEYVPSEEFFEKPVFTAMPQRTRSNQARSRMGELEKLRKPKTPLQHTSNASIKDQIKNLSPEMKVMMLTNVLGRYDDEEPF